MKDKKETEKIGFEINFIYNIFELLCRKYPKSNK